MDYKRLTDKVSLPVLGIGTWGMGGTVEIDHSTDAESIHTLRTGVALGMNLIDTSEFYSQGHTEKLIRTALADVPRDAYFLTTRAGVENLAYDNLLNSAKESLFRLGTNYTDLYLVQKRNPTIPIAETMRALDYLVDHGYARFIGVSNFTKEDLKEAQKHAHNKICVNQIEYNLLVRNKGRFTTNMESAIIPYCQQNDILVMAWKPLARGEILHANIPILDTLARKYTKTKTQIALNWLLTKPNIIAIPGTKNIHHLEANLGALGWNLDAEDAHKLDKLGI